MGVVGSVWHDLEDAWGLAMSENNEQWEWWAVCGTT